MSEEVSADEAAAAQFRTVLRGYDPEAVRTFVTELSGALRAAETERQRLSKRLEELGDRDLRTEFDLVSDDLKRILYEAQVTADGLRERAAADTDQWRAEAREQSAVALQAAQEDAEALRREAWATSEQMVDQSAEEAERIRQGAERDALSIIGEAEREAHRTVSAARREAEDLVRVSKMEADRLNADTRSRHDEIIDEARKEAESAQERARALEVRRAELLTELETVRSTIQRLESQIDVKTTEPPEPTEPATVRVVPSAEPAAEEGAEPEVDVENDTTEWGTEENVRIVPSPGAQPEVPESPEAPVDATEMADEVRRLRGTQEPEPQPELETELETERKTERETERETERDTEPELVTEPVTDKETDSDQAVDELFASLRLEPVAEPEAEPQAASAAEETPEPPTEAETEEPKPSSDPGEMRAKLIVPIVNKRLRNLKRRLTDAQSLALEELRNDGDWSPSPELLASELRSELMGLVIDSFRAGSTGAAELYGIEVGEVEPSVADPTEDFSQSLCEEVQSVLDRSREADQSPPKISSAVSRVYRSWRADHAERRVAALAESSYSEGMRVSLAAAGIDADVASLTSS